MRNSLLAGIVASSLGLTASASAVEKNAEGIAFFEAKIRPVLVKHCYECHSSKASKVKGGLLLDTRQGVLQGGDSGEVIHPGKADASLLLKSLRHDGLKMPPKDRLPESVVSDFAKWINMGAPDPREGTAAKAYKTLTLEEAKTFWSFKQPSKHVPPTVKNSAWPRSDIDRFVLAQLDAKGLHPVGDAAPATLLRRLYFDLTGLPPAPADLDNFQQAAIRNPQSAMVEVVDQLLASPHFGERWGRYWLDVARYAETNGNADNTPFPFAYRYRDYVIKALNADKPYDQFVREQIAGDLLPSRDGAERDQMLAATGFLALTSKPRAQNNPEYKYDLIADQIDVTTRSIMGLSVMCARCHDHKFDPISTKEYYSLAGIFDSSVMLFGGGGGKGAGAKKGGGGGGMHTLSDGGVAMGVREGKPSDLRVLVRGEVKNLGDLAPRGYLKAVPVASAPALNLKQSGRLELAQYLSSPANPFTARVAVNRIWQHLFGQGLVRSPDNFGNLGEAPTHPELLDHLALQFVEQGWSVKKMIKSIVLSRTYQLASSHDAANGKLDPDNFALWHMPVRRLDAEAIRDALLAVSGDLKREPLQGTLLGTFQPKGKNASKQAADSNYRSVYLAMVRGAPLPEVLALFDIANPNLVVAQREVTTVPAQALYLLNSTQVQGYAKSFAQRVLAQSGSDEDRVDHAYKTAFGRPATAGERQQALAFMTEFAREAGREGRGTAWQTFCQTLLAAAEFRYIE